MPAHDMTVLHNTWAEKVEECYDNIRQTLKENRETKTFYIHVIAGRSVCTKENRRAMIFNEYEARERTRHAKDYQDFHHYYRTYDLEAEIHDLSIEFPNSYHLVLYMSYDVPERTNFNLYTFQ